MNEEEIMVKIPIEEYEHLKECKARLIEILERRIAELRRQMSEMKMKGAINVAIPLPNSTLLDKACMWLRENYIPPAFGNMTKVEDFVEQFKQAMERD